MSGTCFFQPACRNPHCLAIVLDRMAWGGEEQTADCVGARREDFVATGEDDVVLGPVCLLDAPLVLPHHRPHWWCSHHLYRWHCRCYYYCSRRGVVRCEHIVPATAATAPIFLATPAGAWQDGGDGAQAGSSNRHRLLRESSRARIRIDRR